MTYVSDQGFTGERKDKEWKFYSLHAVSQEEKETADYLYFWANYFISQAKKDGKTHINKAYFQKKGTRDPYRDLRLNHNYGIEPPIKVPHIPIIEPYWRRLKGTFKSTPIRFQTTTNNTSAHILKQKEKTQEILKNIAVMEEQIFDMRKQGMNTQAIEKFVDLQRNKLKSRIETEFRSSLEIQAQHALNYLVERCNVKDVLDDLFDDYGVCRLGLWQCKVERPGQMPTFRALDPRNTYFSKSNQTKWVRDCDAYVIKERMLLTDVLVKYGEYLDKEQLKLIEDKKQLYWSYFNNLYNEKEWERLGMNADFSQEGLKGEYIDVYYVEWKAMNKKTENNTENLDKQGLGDDVVSGPDKIFGKGYRQDLYCSVRIGDSIYLKSGKIETVVRHQDDPDRCYLTADGIIYDSRFDSEESLWQKCAHLADEYDIYKQKMSKIISKAGPKVRPVIMSNIPLSYGKTNAERLVEHHKRLKEGIYEWDINQAGFNAQAEQIANQAMFDNAISQDLTIMIEILNFIEEMIGRIMGVPRQALGDIAEGDGKGTTQLALLQYIMMSQDIFMDMHKVTQTALTSLINAFRIAFPNGFEASYSDQGKSVHFKTDKGFSLASFNVFLSNTGEEQALLDLFRQIASDMAAQGTLNKEDLIAIMSAKSLAEVQRELYKKLEEAKETMVSDLQQQLAQMEQQLAEMKRQVDVNQQAENENNAAKLQIEQNKVQLDAELKQTQIDNEKHFQDRKIDLDQKRVNLEGAQILAQDKSSMEVRNS